MTDLVQWEGRGEWGQRTAIGGSEDLAGRLVEQAG